MGIKLELKEIPKTVIQLVETRSENLSKTLSRKIEEISDADPLALQLVKSFYRYWISHQPWSHTFEELNELSIHFDVQKKSHHNILKLLVILTIDCTIRKNLGRNKKVQIKKIMSSPEVVQWQKHLDIKSSDYFPYFSIYILENSKFFEMYKTLFKSSMIDFLTRVDSSTSTGKKLYSALVNLYSNRTPERIDQLDKILHRVFCRGELAPVFITNKIFKPVLKYWLEHFFKLDQNQGLKKYTLEHIIDHIFDGDPSTMESIAVSGLKIEDLVSQPQTYSRQYIKAVSRVIPHFPINHISPEDKLLFLMEIFKIDLYTALTDLQSMTQDFKQKITATFEEILNLVIQKNTWEPTQKRQFARKLMAKFLKIPLKKPEFQIPIELIEKYLNFDHHMAEANIYFYASAEKKGNLKLMAATALKPIEIFDNDLFLNLLLNLLPQFISKNIIFKDFIHVFAKKITHQNRVQFYNLIELEILRDRNTRLCESIDKMHFGKKRDKGPSRLHHYSKINTIRFLYEIYQHFPLPELTSHSTSDLELISQLAIHHAFFVFLNESPVPPSILTLTGKINDRLNKIRKESENGDLNVFFRDFRLFLNNLESPTFTHALRSETTTPLPLRPLEN